MNIRLVVLGCIPGVLLSTASFADRHHSYRLAPAVTARTPHTVIAEKSVVSPGSQQSLNPQPLPPKIGNVNAVNAGDAVSLNPQPLPPKVGVSDSAAAQDLKP
jgi:hypothetical protein